MQEYICLNCGKVMQFERKVSVRLFCSHSCAAQYGRRHRNPLHYEGDWKKINDTTWECKFNEGVGCRNRHCARCGWNPDVAKKRTEAMA